METPITVADILNGRGMAFFEQHDMGFLSILTDRGTEFCGRADAHGYQLYFAVNNIDHSKIKAMLPQMDRLV